MENSLSGSRSDAKEYTVRETHKFEDLNIHRDSYNVVEKKNADKSIDYSYQEGEILPEVDDYSRHGKREHSCDSRGSYRKEDTHHRRKEDIHHRRKSEYESRRYHDDYEKDYNARRNYSKNYDVKRDYNLDDKHRYADRRDRGRKRPRDYDEDFSHRKSRRSDNFDSLSEKEATKWSGKLHGRGDYWNKKRHVYSDEDKIVWPPTVMIENLLCGYNQETKKWKSIQNEDIRACLKSLKELDYRRVVAIWDFHGPRGNALIYFHENYTGYTNADGLSERLRQAGRGREDWIKARPRYSRKNGGDWEKWKTEKLMEDNGKRILYGYLVTPSDLNYIKLPIAAPKLYVTSYREKVLKQMKDGQKETEEFDKEIDELKEEAEEKIKALEAEEQKYSEVAVDLQKKSIEVQKLNMLEKEAERMHQARIEENKIAFKEAEIREEKYYRWREMMLFGQLSKKREQFQEELQRYLLEDQKIDEEEQKQEEKLKLKLKELNKKRVEKMMKLEKALSAKMAKKREDLEGQKNQRILALQRRHQEEKLKFKAKHQKQKEDVLKELADKQMNLKNDLDNAKVASYNASQTTKKATSCLKCKSDFDDTVQRTYCEICHGMDVCVECADKQWKREKACLICKSKLENKLIAVPKKIYL